MALWLMWIPEAGSAREERVAFLQIPRGYISLFIIIIPLSTPYYAWHVVHSPAAYLVVVHLLRLQSSVIPISH